MKVLRPGLAVVLIQPDFAGQSALFFAERREQVSLFARLSRRSVLSFGWASACPSPPPPSQHVAVVYAASELLGKAQLEEVDRPAASPTLIPAKGMGELVAVGHDRELAPQGDGVGRRAVRAVTAASPFKLPEPERGLLAIDAAQILVELEELELSLPERAAPMSRGAQNQPGRGA